MARAIGTSIAKQEVKLGVYFVTDSRTPCGVLEKRRRTVEQERVFKGFLSSYKQSSQVSRKNRTPLLLLFLRVNEKSGY